MRGNQLTPFLGRQRCRVVWLLEKIAHGLVPEQARVRLAHDLIKLRFGVFPFCLLVLQQHRVLDRVAAAACERARAITDG